MRLQRWRRRNEDDNETKQKVWARAIEMVYSGRYDHWTGSQVREALEKEFGAEIVQAVLFSKWEPKETDEEELCTST